MMRLGMYPSAPHRRMGHFPRQMGRKRSFDAPTNRTPPVGRSCLTLPYVDREHTLRQPTTKRYLLAFHGMMINAAFPPPLAPLPMQIHLSIPRCSPFPFVSSTLLLPSALIYLVRGKREKKGLGCRGVTGCQKQPSVF